jgi:hypothetical protein
MEFLLNKVISAKQDYITKIAIKIAAFDKNDESA